MPSLKSIRKRIVSVKSTQKITRAMKMVAGARLTRAQQRILALRPYATKTQEVLSAVVAANGGSVGSDAGDDEALAGPDLHPLLQRRAVKKAAYLLITSDRGLCGGFNTNLLKAAERQLRADTAAGKEVTFFSVGRKGRDYLRRREAPISHIFPNTWDTLSPESAREITRKLLEPFNDGSVDAIYLIYSQFKSAIAQEVVVQPLLPVQGSHLDPVEKKGAKAAQHAEQTDYLFEPDRRALLDRLVPMYLEISVLRALYESQASELGARMTAMDAATKNAKEMILKLTLQYNRARQAAITTELMEIIGGSEALKE
jgi:F-type H+-transporting ATPase subunit gamma